MKKILIGLISIVISFMSCSDSSPREIESEKNKSTKIDTLLVPKTSTTIPKKIEGTYLQGNVTKGGAYLAVQEKEVHKLKFQLNLYRGAPTYNSGLLEGEVDYVDSVATYVSTTGGELCTVVFTFTKDKVMLNQKGTELDCGFGAGVRAAGELRKTNTRAVFLDENGAPIE